MILTIYNWILLTLIMISLMLDPKSCYAIDHPSTKMKNRTFQHGEELNYSMNYGPIHGGECSIRLDFIQYDNKPAFHAILVAKSVGLTDLLYKIEDIYESYFDTLTCLPYKSIRNIREGGYKYYDEVLFAHNDSLLFSQKSGKVKVPPNILDIVSSLFYLRSLELDTLNNGTVLKITTYFGDEIFPFLLRYRGKEVVKTKLGKFDCYRFDPIVETGRVFESKDDMTFWITADKNLVPLRIRLKIIVGSLYCDLTSYKNLVTSMQPVE